MPRTDIEVLDRAIDATRALLIEAEVARDTASINLRAIRPALAAAEGNEMRARDRVAAFQAAIARLSFAKEALEQINTPEPASS